MKKSKKVEKPLENPFSDGISEHYRPFLIHFSTYSILTDQILMLMPCQRNVLLTMSEYEMHKINPFHPKNSDAPTHLIIFSIRFIADDTFQPIGALLIYKSLDQSHIVAECIKAYINDLWKLNLYVVATVSPPSKIFKNIVGHLIKNNEINKYSDVISYSVEPIKEIVHIYDVQFLIIKLQHLLQEGDIMFKTKYEDSNYLIACWKDISVVMNIAPEFKMISDYLSSKDNVSRRVHIFTDQIFIKYLEANEKGLLSEKAKGCTELLNAISTFLKFFEYDFVNPPEHILNWSDLIYVLSTMTFQRVHENRKFKKGAESTKNSKTDKFDLKVALQQMDCDINLMSYGTEQEKDNNFSRLIDKESNCDNKKEKVMCIKSKGNSDVEKIDCENKGKPHDYESNCVTRDLICTLKGIKQLMSLMASRRVRQIKPNALIVEHIDYFVTQIQTKINRLDSVLYYGHPYKFMDADLAFDTIKNTKGLYLLSKD